MEFKYIGFELWAYPMKVIQKRVVLTKLDMYDFIKCSWPAFIVVWFSYIPSFIDPSVVKSILVCHWFLCYYVVILGRSKSVQVSLWFVYMYCHWGSHYQEAPGRIESPLSRGAREVWEPIIRFNSVICMCLSQSRTCSSNVTMVMCR